MRYWDLGVCRDNVRRKGRVPLPPQNGFWAIRFCEEEYCALIAPATPLTVKGKPLSVGVFLDYEAAPDAPQGSPHRAQGSRSGLGTTLQSSESRKPGR